MQFFANLTAPQRKILFGIAAVVIIVGYLLITRNSDGPTTAQAPTEVNTATQRNDGEGGIGAGGIEALLTPDGTARGFVEQAYTGTYSESFDQWARRIAPYITGVLAKDVWTLNLFHPKTPTGKALTQTKATAEIEVTRVEPVDAAFADRERQKFIVVGDLKLTAEEGTRPIKSRIGVLVNVISVGESWRVIGMETLGPGYGHTN